MEIIKMTKPAVFIIVLMFTVSMFGQQYEANWASLDKREIPEWFEDAKFGIFIHWGVYSVPAYRVVSEKKYASYAEWYYARVMFDEVKGGAEFHNKNFGEDFDYHDFAPDFKAELFDPDKWAEMFKNSGARYVVLTSKHHDGYCLWPSSHPRKKNWNSMDVGPKRDLVGDLTTAVKAQGMKMGLYYSMIEWESSPTARMPSGWWLPERVHQKYRIPEQEYVDMVKQQIREIVTKYEPSLLFSDGGEWDGSAEYWGTQEYLKWLYSESQVKDEVVVNDRWCKECPGEHGDYYSSEYQDAEGVGVDYPWEESRGMGDSYGFNRAEYLEHYNSSTELIHELIDIVGRGGNLLLNVGPTSDGRIPVIMQERLFDIGQWLDVNGEAIYGSRPFIQGISGNQAVRFTQKDNAVYVICMDWPGSFVALDGIPDKSISEITLLGMSQPLEYSRKQQRMLITSPILNPTTIPCQHAWVFKIKFAQ
jgi:alpha-L-fucosidase